MRMSQIKTNATFIQIIDIYLNFINNVQKLFKSSNFDEMN